MYIASQSHVSKVKKRYFTIFCAYIFSKTAHSEVLNFGTFSWHFSKHIKASSVAPQRLDYCLSYNFQCRYSVSCVKNRIFVAAIGSEWIRWKGNRVQIPNSPAAVSSRFWTSHRVATDIFSGRQVYVRLRVRRPAVAIHRYCVSRKANSALLM